MSYYPQQCDDVTLSILWMQHISCYHIIVKCLKASFVKHLFNLSQDSKKGDQKLDDDFKEIFEFLQKQEQSSTSMQTGFLTLNNPQKLNKQDTKKQNQEKKQENQKSACVEILESQIPGKENQVPMQIEHNLGQSTYNLPILNKENEMDINLHQQQEKQNQIHVTEQELVVMPNDTNKQANTDICKLSHKNNVSQIVNEQSNTNKENQMCIDNLTVNDSTLPNNQQCVVDSTKKPNTNEKYQNLPKVNEEVLPSTSRQFPKTNAKIKKRSEAGEVTKSDNQEKPKVQQVKTPEKQIMKGDAYINLEAMSDIPPAQQALSISLASKAQQRRQERFTQHQQR